MLISYGRRVETTLEMVRRHVREGATRVAQQSELVAELHNNGRPTEEAEQLLRLFQQVQGEHERHLARLEG